MSVTARGVRGSWLDWADSALRIHALQSQAADAKLLPGGRHTTTANPSHKPVVTSQLRGKLVIAIILSTGLGR
jgi:hypothetical protein